MAKIEEKFWNYVQIGGRDECWPFKRTLDGRGYGQFYWNNKAHRAHRIAFLLHNGGLPSGKCICHSCDRPDCCNPHHLWAGTHQDNSADMARKGRWNGHRGEANSRAKLTNEDISIIRNAPPRHGAALARQFGISRAHVCRIRACRVWKHVRVLPFVTNEDGKGAKT
jgi:hypothetical protein